jgi:hypothetical protein
MNYNIDENVPLSVTILKNNGTPDTGKTVLIYIIDDDNAATVINGGAMTEDILGYYRYSFTHGQTVNKTYSWYALETGTFVGGGKFRVTTDKQDLTNTIDFSDGRAV